MDIEDPNLTKSSTDKDDEHLLIPLKLIEEPHVM
jgi:hypothetical protein